jgi:large subunit ribosomal protein L9
MRVILTMDVAEIGSRGDRVEVAAGYARNFLIPRRLAVPDTAGNLRVMEEEGKLTDVRDRKAQREAQKVQTFLNEHELFTTLKIGREGKAFGAVTVKDIAILLRQAGLEVDRRRIRLEGPIKRLGIFEVPLAIHPEVDTVIKLFVDRDGGSKEGASKHQEAYDEERRILEEAAKAEAKARAEREREAEEAARIAIEKAQARKQREEEEAKAREEAQEAARKAESDAAVAAGAVKDESEDSTPPKAESSDEDAAEPSPEKA